MPVYDLRWYCPHGMDVYAVGPGKVYSVGHDPKRGESVLIDHHVVPGYGPLATWYQHLHEPMVEAGDIVEAGDVVGVLGASWPAHLHIEWRDCNRGTGRRATVVDPEPFLKAMERLVISMPE